jgi:predicted metal-dependent peptidase
MNWQEVIRQSIEAQIKSDFTLMKPSRRGWSCDAIMPSMKKEPAIECTIAIDLSGSIGQTEMKDFFSEIAGIMEQHASYKITLLTWDNNCYLSGIFTEDDGVDEMLKAEMKGGGGTDPTCIWQFMEENDMETKQLLIFTDGYVASWGDEFADRFPTTWLMYKNPNAVASHGDSIYYE